MDNQFDERDREQVDDAAEDASTRETPGNVDDGKNNAPEPPSRWRPDTAYKVEPNNTPNNTPSKPRPAETISGMMGTTKVVLHGEEALEFQRARGFMTVSQIAAIVSLFIGGIFASGIALALACFANGKLTRIGQAHPEQPDLLRAFQRTGRMAIGVAVAALAINVITFFVLYPYAMDILNSGDLGALMGSPQTSGSNTSTWG